MNRADIALGASAAGCITAGGVLLALTEHLPFGSGMCASLATASTSGCDTSASGAVQAVSAALMLLAIPLLGALFARLTARHSASKVSEHVEAAEGRIKAHLEERLAAHHRTLIANGALKPSAERMARPKDKT